MDVFNGFEELSENYRGAVVTLGVYDGLHRAHIQIIGQVIESAQQLNSKSMMLTFDPHPRNVLNSQRTQVKSLSTPAEKLRILSDTSLDGILFLKVDRALLDTESEQFIRNMLVKALEPRKVIVGYDYHFGKNRGGHTDQLLDYGRKYGFDVDIVPPIKIDNRIVRSSGIRTLLADGDVETAAVLLGREYRVSGTVVHGSGRGKTLGFPTANIEPDSRDKMIPADGIYLTQCRTDNTKYFGICNIGVRKTFNEHDRVIEVYLMDMENLDLYGANLEMSFLQRLRDEIQYETSEALVKQMKKDEIECRERIKQYVNEMED